MYCGRCGMFYWPQCPNRPEGGCQPAVNPYDMQIVEAQARVVIASALVAMANSFDPLTENRMAKVVADLKRLSANLRGIMGVSNEDGE